MNRWLLLPALLLLGGFLVRGADASPEAAPAVPVTDPAQVSLRYADVAARPEYHESEETDIGSRLKDELSQWFLHLGAKFGQFQYSGEMPAFASMLMTVLVGLCLAGLLYVMVRLTRRRSGMEIKSTVEAPGPKTFHPPEFYDDEIDRATREENWQRAWQAAWKQFLSRLENRQLVHADRTRTNREYLTQLRSHSLPASVLDLLNGMVDAYDHTIYGRQPIAETDWNRFHRQIEEAALMLHLDEKAAATRINLHKA